MFFRWYPDEIARLATGQSGSNIGASNTPRLRFFGSAASGLEMVAWQPKGLKRCSEVFFAGNRIEKGERDVTSLCVGRDDGLLEHRS